MVVLSVRAFGHGILHFARLHGLTVTVSRATDVMMGSTIPVCWSMGVRKDVEEEIDEFGFGKRWKELGRK